MEYKVAKIHSMLKPGSIIKAFNGTFYHESWCHEFSRDEIDSWLESGWIEEIQELEFTRRDMLEFGNICVNRTGLFNTQIELSRFIIDKKPKNHGNKKNIIKHQG